MKYYEDLTRGEVYILNIPGEAHSASLKNRFITLDYLFRGGKETLVLGTYETSKDAHRFILHLYKSNGLIESYTVSKDVAKIKAVHFAANELRLISETRRVTRYDYEQVK